MKIHTNERNEVRKRQIERNKVVNGIGINRRKELKEGKTTTTSKSGTGENMLAGYTRKDRNNTHKKKKVMKMIEIIK